MESIKLLPILWDGPCGNRLLTFLLGIVWWSRPPLIKHLWIGWGGHKWALWALLALESLVVTTLLKSTRRAFGALNLWSVFEGNLLPSHFLLFNLSLVLSSSFWFSAYSSNRPFFIRWNLQLFLGTVLVTFTVETQAGLGTGRWYSSWLFLIAWIWCILYKHKRHRWWFFLLRESLIELFFPAIFQYLIKFGNMRLSEHCWILLLQIIKVCKKIS